VITMDNAHLPFGYVPTGSLRQEMKIEQDRTQRVDFGVVPRSGIAGVVFNDLKGDGKFDLTDKGIAKARLVLEDGQSAKSDGIGSYSFSEMIAGEHTVTLDLSSLAPGYLPVEAPKKSVTLYEGIRYQLNFAVRAQRSLAGRVYFDENKNRQMDEGERPVPNVRVFLGAQSTTTDAEGWYLFDNLPQGSYELFADEKDLAGKTSQRIHVDLPDEPVTLSGQNIAVYPRETGITAQ